MDNTLDIFHYSFFVFLALSLIGQGVLYILKYRIIKDKMSENMQDRQMIISLLQDLSEETKKSKSQIIVLDIELKAMKEIQRDIIKLLASKNNDNE